MITNILGLLATLDEGTIIAEDSEMSVKTPVWKPFALVAYSILKIDYKFAVCKDMTSYILVDV
jgi:hypothetical protein